MSISKNPIYINAANYVYLRLKDLVNTEQKVDIAILDDIHYNDKQLDSMKAVRNVFEVSDNTKFK